MERFFARLLNKNKITALIELGRPWNGILVILLSIFGANLFLGHLPNLDAIKNLSLVTILIYMGSSALNDLFDIKVDSINMPFRPLERGSLKVKDVIYFLIFCYIIGNLLALNISFNYFLSTLLMSISSIIYSLPPFSLKDRGLLGNFNLAFATIFTTLYSGAVLISNSLSVISTILMPSLSLIGLFTFFSILKDFKDMGGDRIHKKHTTSVKYGMKNASLLNILGTFIFFPFTIIIFYSIFQSEIFLLFSMFLFVSLLIQELNLYHNLSSREGEKSWSRGRFIFLLFTLTLFLF